MAGVISTFVAYIVKIVSVDDPALASIRNKNQFVVLAVSIAIKTTLVEEAREITFDNTTQVVKYLVVPLRTSGLSR